MYSDSCSSSSLGSGSRSGESGNKGSGHLASEGGIEMEIIPDTREDLMSAYFFPHLMFNYGYLIKFVC